MAFLMGVYGGSSKSSFVDAEDPGCDDDFYDSFVASPWAGSGQAAVPISGRILAREHRDLAKTDQRNEVRAGGDESRSPPLAH